MTLNKFGHLNTIKFFYISLIEKRTSEQMKTKKIDNRNRNDYSLYLLIIIVATMLLINFI